MVKLEIEIPNVFFEEEVRNGYIVTKQMKEVWAVELDILYRFNEVCKRNGLRYFADGGTTLGAIRHGGFIPWDDDIDIVMLRDDYEKLCKIASEEFKYPYFFQTEYTDPGSLRGHIQIRRTDTTAILKAEMGLKKFNQGIFIDIFPLDYIPSDIEERVRYLSVVEKKMKKANWFPRYVARLCDYPILKRLYLNVLPIINTRKIKVNKRFIEFERFIKENDLKKTDFLGKLFFVPIPQNCFWRAEWFSESVMVPFEMISIPVSKHYDEIMTVFFGDWRTPVIQDSTHGNIIFDTDKTYKEYLK